jgi:hypothetical protein
MLIYHLVYYRGTMNGADAAVDKMSVRKHPLRYQVGAMYDNLLPASRVRQALWTSKGPGKNPRCTRELSSAQQKSDCCCLQIYDDRLVYNGSRNERTLDQCCDYLWKKSKCVAKTL